MNEQRFKLTRKGKKLKKALRPPDWAETELRGMYHGENIALILRSMNELRTDEIRSLKELYDYIQPYGPPTFQAFKTVINTMISYGLLKEIKGSENSSKIGEYYSNQLDAYSLTLLMLLFGGIAGLIIFMMTRKKQTTVTPTLPAQPKPKPKPWWASLPSAFQSLADLFTPKPFEPKIGNYYEPKDVVVVRVEPKYNTLTVAKLKKKLAGNCINHIEMKCVGKQLVNNEWWGKFNIAYRTYCSDKGWTGAKRRITGGWVNTKEIKGSKVFYGWV